jgi:hypothetical protein
VDIEAARDIAIDLLEEVEELGRTVPFVAFPDDDAGGDIERGEQRGRAPRNGLVTVWFRSLVFHYATLASKAKGLMPPRYECRRRAL